MEYNKQAFWIIYVFFLITLILSFWFVILNKQAYFEKSLEGAFIQDILSKNILTQATLSINYLKENNKNNGLYIPFLSCPEEVKIFSWSELTQTGKTTFDNNNCTWTFNWENLILYYTWNYTTFWSGELGWNGFELSWENILTGTFSPLDVSFEKPTIFQDDFIKARTEINGIIIKNTWFQNIFWNNTQINNFISSNTNNSLPFLSLWNTSSWVLYLDITDSFSGKIITFDKVIFDMHNKLVQTDEINFSHSWWIIGYLQDDLSFSGSLWNPKVFDFESNNYAIFLSYNTWILDNIRYNLRVFSYDGVTVYINPIKDDTDNIEFLGNTILIHNWQYFYKIYKVTDYK